MCKISLITILCIGLIASCKCNSNKTGNSDNNSNTTNTGSTSKPADTERTNINNDPNALAEEYSFYLKNDKAKAIEQKKASAQHKALTAGFFPEGSERLLEENDIQFLTDWGYKIMLNEIYARHGMKFKDETLKRHFDKQTWYHPANNDVYKMLSAIEKQNVAYLINNQENNTRH